MPPDDLTDVPVPKHHNFLDISDARAWAEESMLERPWREDFFRIFVRELRAASARTVLELGSGPGFLAQRILEALPQIEYTALDFSPAMHTLARERLGGLASRVRFVEANFKESGWETGLPIFDAVVSMQAAHEVRHKLRIPPFYTTRRAAHASVSSAYSTSSIPLEGSASCLCWKLMIKGGWQRYLLRWDFVPFI